MLFGARTSRSAHAHDADLEVVSLAGMRLGQSVRARLRPQTFRLCFFFGLLALGAYLALRGLG